MDVRKLVDKFGGQSALAAQLGITQSAVAYWVKQGSVPSKWHSQILSRAVDKAIQLDASDLIARPGGQEAPSGTAARSLAVGPSESAIDGSKSGHSPFMFYASATGAIKVQVLIEDETVWTSQKGMAEIFDVDVRTINEHLQNIFASQELSDISVIRKFRITAGDGKSYETNFYSLDAIISVGYRVSSHKATQFRVWATNLLKEYLLKGYALDDDRLKQGRSLFGKDYFDDLLEKIREIRASERRFYQKITDIYAQCSIDYDANSPISQQFYAHVQDKLHYAIHGHTSAELIELRADASKPNMGLTHWKNEGSGGKITKTDVTIGKNYLTKSEIGDLDRLVSMYLDWAENFARRQRPLTMVEWAKKLDGFLEFNAYAVLGNFGTVRRETAERRAVQEYEKFRVVQDKTYKSDFDRIVDDLKITKRLPNESRG